MEEAHADVAGVRLGARIGARGRGSGHGSWHGRRRHLRKHHGLLVRAAVDSKGARPVEALEQAVEKVERRGDRKVEPQRGADAHLGVEDVRRVVPVNAEGGRGGREGLVRREGRAAGERRTGRTTLFWKGGPRESGGLDAVSRASGEAYRALQ